MQIVLLTKDLMLSSQLGGAVQQHGGKIAVALSPDDLVSKAEAAGADIVWLDLGMPGLDLKPLVSRLQALERPPRAVMALGPHVEEDVLQAAAEAGCDPVLPRGRFIASASELVRQFAG